MTETLLQKPANTLVMLLAAGALIWLSNQNLAKSVPAFDVQQVETQAAKALIDAGAAIVDVRPKSVYEAKHIPGAVSIPLEDLKKAVPASLDASKTKSVVVYCGDGSTRGPEATYVLNHAGFPGAVNLKRGMHGWTSAGYPVQAG